MSDKHFKVTFNEWNEETGVVCDFCNTNPPKYYCNFLVTGWCEKCIKELETEYKEEK